MNLGLIRMVALKRSCLVSRLFTADRTIGGLCTLFGIVVFFLSRRSRIRVWTP